MRNRVKVVSAALLTGLLLPSTYSIDLNPKSAYTVSTSSSVHQEQVAFYAYSDISQALDAVKNAKKEEALKSVNENLAKGNLKISPKKIENGTKNLPKNLDEVTSLAYPVDEVKKNAELRAGLQDAIQNGKRVYLYGGVTYDEYRELLKLNEISVTLTSDTGEKRKITHGGRDKALQDKGPLKQKSNKAVTEKEGTYDIIGYTLNDNSPYKLFVSSINSSNNKKSKPSDEVYLREILDDASYVVGQPEQQQQTTSLGIFKLNTAYATNTIVKTAAQRYVGSAYDGPTVIGKTVTDWTLEQNKNETVADFDFFLVKDSTQIYEYYGNYAKSLLTDHDIPYDSDKIQDWGPNDSSSSPYNIEIGAPWVVNFQFSMSSDPDVDDQGSLDLDYGRWETSVFTGSLGNEVFKAWTGWKSSGTYATMDIRENAHFVDNEGYSVDSSILIDVTYDY